MSEEELYPTPDEYDNYTMKESPTYTPPKVWQWDQDGEENRFSKINRPIAGPTHDKDLPVGEHPLQLYSLATPNGVKVTVMLEELLALGIKEAEYDAWLVNIMEGDQFSSGFVSANPNSKIPALVDHSTPTPTRVFESAAIVMYLADFYEARTVLEVPTERAARAPSGQRVNFPGCSGKWAATRPFSGWRLNRLVGHFYAFCTRAIYERSGHWGKTWSETPLIALRWK